METKEIVRTGNEGNVRIEALPNGLNRIVLEPKDPNLYIESRECSTSFSLELIDYIVQRYPYSGLCSCIARYADSEFLRLIQRQLFTYLRPRDFVGKRLLDFGCGAGPSTFAIASLLPGTEIVGVDLSPERIDIAKKIAETNRIQNVTFLLSRSGDTLPHGMGTFDYVTLNAVYEHLLPEERKTVMPLLWSVMRPLSVLFVNQTPHRFFPYEHHSTRLWLINYLPDSIAHWMARRFARLNPQINGSHDWNVLLRGGIRGATEKEIVRNLIAGSGGQAKIIQPTAEGISDRASYWLSMTDPHHLRLLKQVIAVFFRYCDRLTGIIPSLNIDVAIRKESGTPAAGTDVRLLRFPTM